MTTTKNVSTAIYQVATALPATAAGWTFVRGGVVKRCEEGAGQFLGSAELEWHAGLNVLPGPTNTTATNVIQSFLGQYVRVLYYNPIGGTVVVNGYSYDVLWYGIINRQTTIPDGASLVPGGLQAFHAVGIAAGLDNIYIRQGFAYGYTAGVGTGPWDPGYCPLFNARPTKLTNVFGDRYSSTQTNADGSQSAYPFDLSRTSATSNPWTAAQVVTHLLAFYSRPVVPTAFGTMYGPTWTLNDPLNFLAYTVDKLDLQGRTILEAINYLINPRRGCTWRTSVSGTTITINVYSGAVSSVTSGSVTIPASTTTCSLDARGNHFIQGLTISEDVSAKYEYIQVDGDHPLVACSLMFNVSGSGASLIKGWDATMEATGDGVHGPWDPAENQGPAYENVWRRFLLDDAWSGVNYAQTTIGLRNKRTNSSAGYSGARTFDATESAAPAQTLKVEKFIPLPADISYETTPAANTLDMTTPLMAPRLFIKDGSDYSEITDNYSVSVEEDPAAIVLDGDLDELSTLLDGGASLIVTIGVREANPLMTATLSGAAGTWDRDYPKCMLRRLPYCEQWVALQGTVVGVNAAGTAFYTLSSTLTVVDDTPKLSAWLAVLKSWYGYTSVTATWTDTGQIEYANGTGTFQPGSLLTTVHRGDAALTCNAMITTRAWDFTEAGFGTTYTTERIIPDVSSVETHPRVNKIWQSTAQRDSLL